MNTTTTTSATATTTTEKPKRNRKDARPDAKDKTTPKRRTAAQRIADLQAEIERVKEREAAKELRADPAVKMTAAAVRAINKALGEAKEAELREALSAAKGTLAAYLEGKGLRVPRPGKKQTAA